MGAAAGRLDQRLEVLDLALHRVGLGVAATPAAAPAVVEDGEARGQFLRERDVLRAVDGAAADEDDPRAVAGALVGDRGPVRVK
jgi:hypothetical protein